MSVASQPRKVRLRAATAPLSVKRKALGAHLSRELRAKLKRRSAVLRRGDTVLVMRGKWRGFKGKVTRCNVRRGIVFVEGITRRRARGQRDMPVPIRPCALLILEMVERK